jgi:hypothetical protein
VSLSEKVQFSELVIVLLAALVAISLYIHTYLYFLFPGRLADTKPVKNVTNWIIYMP